VPQLFQVEDFDLKGKVKSCLVVTNYGREEYEFDKEGNLTKSVTRFSDSDYDITYYIYKEGELREKRMENYRDGEFEPTTSFASFYTLDQIDPRKVTEKIFSYDKEFLDSHQYVYDGAGRLIKINHSSTESEDETLISYKGDDKNLVRTITLNETTQKAISTSTDIESGKRTILETRYLKGIPSSAVEQIFSANSQLLSETKLVFESDSKMFIAHEQKNYEYDDKNGMLIKLTTRKNNSEKVQEYIYQFDSGDSGNWIKEIITPDNLYTTRKIKYYLEEKIAKKE
jgi:hypothetical protein